MITLGDKFKANERELESRIQPGGFIVIRLDGKAFHTFTKSFDKPFDKNISYAMDVAAECIGASSDIPASFIYTQSDEISVVIDNRTQQTWMGGRVQKIASVAASYATAYFNQNIESGQIATFDARVMRLDSEEDVYSYLLWRKADSNRNALSALAQAHFSHKKLQGKNKGELFEMIYNKEPDDLPIPGRHFNGRYFYPETIFTDGIDRITGDTVRVARTRWTGRDDEKMLKTFSKRCYRT